MYTYISLLILLLPVYILTWRSNKHIDTTTCRWGARHGRIYWWRWSDSMPGHRSRHCTAPHRLAGWNIGQGLISWNLYSPGCVSVYFVDYLSGGNTFQPQFQFFLPQVFGVVRLLCFFFFCLVSCMNKPIALDVPPTIPTFQTPRWKIGLLRPRHSNPSAFQNWLNEYFVLKLIHRTDLLWITNQQPFDPIPFVSIYVEKDIFIVGYLTLLDKFIFNPISFYWVINLLYCLPFLH